MVEKLGGRIFIRSDEYDIEFITKGSHMDIHFDSENAVKLYEIDDIFKHPDLP